LESRRPVAPTLAEIAERAEYHVSHIRRHIEEEITRRWESERGAE
jgi:ribosome recycling factor